MTNLPITERALLVRTDFTNAVAWEAVCSAVSKPSPELMQMIAFMQNLNAPHHDFSEETIGSLAVKALDDAAYDAWTVEQLLASVPKDYSHDCLFVFDARSAADDDHALLVLDVHHEPGRAFRTIPSEVQSIDSNFSTGNMDWEEFAESTDEDGVFRGFN